MQNYVTAPQLAALILLYGVMSASIVAIARKRQSAIPGWNLLTPGSAHWFSLFGNCAAVGLMSWVWLFVGSARRDAAYQMQIAFILILAFGICSLISAQKLTSIRATNLRWRGNMLASDGTAGSHKFDMRDVVAFRRSITGTYLFTFRGGQVAKIDPFTKGSDELCAKLFAVVEKEVANSA